MLWARQQRNKIGNKMKRIKLPKISLPDTLPSFRVFTILSTLFLAGVFFSSYLNLSFSSSKSAFLYSIITLLLCFLCNLLLRNRKIAFASLSILIFILGIFNYSSFSRILLKKVPEGEIKIDAKIISKPIIDSKNQQFIAKILTTDQNEKEIVGSRLLFKVPRYPAYNFAETLKVEGEIVPAKDLINSVYYKKDLIIGQITPSNVQFESSGNRFSDKLIGSLFYFSESFEASLKRVIMEPHSSLSAGILLGVKRNMPEELLNSLKICGLTHIIALSGFNITILVVFFADSLLLVVGRKATFLLGLLLVISFVLMTGGSSVERAAIFSLLLLFGKTIGRRGDQTNLMLLAATVLVLINPFVIRYDLSFQLSFLAFAGLIYLSPWFVRKTERIDFRFLKPVKLGISETLGAQTAVMPLILAKFGTVSLISPLANVLVVWIVPWAMGFAFVAGLAGIIYYPAGQLLGFVLWPLLEYIILAVNYLSKVPFASLGMTQ